MTLLLCVQIVDTDRRIVRARVEMQPFAVRMEFHDRHDAGMVPEVVRHITALNIPHTNCAVGAARSDQCTGEIESKANERSFVRLESSTVITPLQRRKGYGYLKLSNRLGWLCKREMLQE